MWRTACARAEAGTTTARNRPVDLLHASPPVGDRPRPPPQRLRTRPTRPAGTWLRLVENLESHQEPRPAGRLARNHLPAGVACTAPRKGWTGTTGGPAGGDRPQRPRSGCRLSRPPAAAQGAPTSLLWSAPRGPERTSAGLRCRGGLIRRTCHRVVRGGERHPGDAHRQHRPDRRAATCAVCSALVTDGRPHPRGCQGRGSPKDESARQPLAPEGGMNRPRPARRAGLTSEFELRRRHARGCATRIDPVPEHGASAAASAAFELRDLDAQLAALIADLARRGRGVHWCKGSDIHPPAHLRGPRRSRSRSSHDGSVPAGVSSARWRTDQSRYDQEVQVEHAGRSRSPSPTSTVGSSSRTPAGNCARGSRRRASSAIVTAWVSVQRSPAFPDLRGSAGDRATRPSRWSRSVASAWPPAGWPVHRDGGPEMTDPSPPARSRSAS